MISTADLALIMDYADRAGALIVPTGDPFQLGPVEVGGMFPALIRQLGAAELSEVLCAAVSAGITGRQPMTAPRARGWQIICTAWDTLLLAGSNEEALTGVPGVSRNACLSQVPNDHVVDLHDLTAPPAEPGTPYPPVALAVESARHADPRPS